MSKITVVAQAPYPIPISSGRHLTPGEIATIDRDAEVESQLQLGFLREVPKIVVEEVPSPVVEAPTRKPRASARDDNQEDKE